MSGDLPEIASRDPQLWTDFLTLCGFGGRLTGSPGEAASRDWAAGRLAAINPAGVRRDMVPYLDWRCSACHLQLSSGEPLEAMPLLCSAATPDGGLTLPVVDCGRGTAEEVRNAGEQIRGKAVLVRHEYMFASDVAMRHGAAPAAALKPRPDGARVPPFPARAR